MYRKIISIVISCLMLMTCTATYADDNSNNKFTIYVNDTEISNNDMCLTDNNEMFIPLRAVLEALGSEVIWEEKTGNVYFSYEDVKYVCKFVALNSIFPENKDILICNVENKDSIYNSDYIQLHPMCASGSYFMLNDRTYLYQDTGRRLFEALGCSVDIEQDKHIIKISN